MSFEDIDTPADDAVLSGIDEPAAPAVTEPAAVDPEPTPVVAEPAPEAAEPAAETPPERAPVIPRARFDEVNAKLHTQREENEALRSQLEALQSKNEPSELLNIEALEQQHFDAMMEGDKDKAVSIRAKINSELSSQAEARATERLNQQLTAREQTTAMNTVAATAYEAYPFLDHKSGDANAEAINDVVEWRDFYAQKGEPIHIALQKAVAKVGPMYAAAPSEPAIVPVDTRKQAAMARNAGAANAQPPAAVAGIGNRAVPQTPKVETQGDWEKLSKAERESILMGS